MATQRKLGKGLGSLLSNRQGSDQEGGPLWLAVEELAPSDQQPRMDLERGLQGLAESLRQHGMMQPILVTRDAEGNYRILAGERRWRAAQLAGMKRVPVLVREGVQDAGERLELALIENVQREDLDPIERAQACRRLLDEHGYTQELVAERLGFQRSTVANLVRLLDLPEEVQADVSRGTLTAGHARALLQVPDPNLRDEARRRIAEDRLSVRQAEELCRRMAKKGAAPPRHRPKPRKPAWVADLQEKLARHLGLRTELHLKVRQGGKLVLHFQDLEELDRLVRSLGLENREADELLEG